ncbi:hypothetical protein [Flagellimonas algicola]|uniref:Uncharacterized protein n=1 Tax=Flagellimonas algicola TaxID=2583815 RepID=A0ABY2WPA0_9FLAO|nr:hypothetical protein [Allomuricauda algicola]TMU56820.1 hypothetical protein FGG15_04550 [Allomuricauda algicola]
MNYQDFLQTLGETKPPEDWPLALRALWFDAKGDWESSHNIAQDLHTQMGSWIHAYLHRKEGDDWNAGYWYRQAGKPFPEHDLGAELQELVEHALH